MVAWADAVVAVSLANALLAAVLGGRMLLATRRLRGLPAARLIGSGFLILALASLLLAPSLGGAFDAWDATRVALSVLGFAAIALGYLLTTRHGDTPERGFAMAYGAFLLAALVGLAPFAAIAALYPLERTIDHGAFAVSASLALGVGVHLLRASGGRRGSQSAAVGFLLLAAGQAFNALAALAEIPTDPSLLAAVLCRLAGLAVLGGLLVRSAGAVARREGSA